MIIRSLIARHGRQAIAAPIARAASRSFATETTSTSTDAAPEPFGPPPLLSSLVTPPKPTLEPTEDPEDDVLTAGPPALTHPEQPKPDTIVGDYLTYVHQLKKTAHLGTKVAKSYRQSDLLLNPPWPKDITLELLMASQAHMGHHPSRWHPANARYIAGIRQDIHIISLEQTAAHLRRAARVVEGIAHAGGLILFVGNRKGQRDATVLAAKLAGGGACHLYTKWTPGTITNRDQILADGELKIVDEMDQEREGFEKHLMDRRPIVPDLVVCFNPKENYPLLYECGLAGVPTIGIIDTDADPTWVTYVVPANDDSIRCTTMMAGILGNAARLGRIRRLRDAKRGVVTWRTAREEASFIQSQNKAKYNSAREHVQGDAIESSINGPFGKAGLQALRQVTKDDFAQGGDGWGRFEGDMEDGRDGKARGAEMRDAFRQIETRMKEERAERVEVNREEKELAKNAMEVAERLEENEAGAEVQGASVPGSAGGIEGPRVSEIGKDATGKVPAPDE